MEGICLGWEGEKKGGGGGGFGVNSIEGFGKKDIVT